MRPLHLACVHLPSEGRCVSMPGATLAAATALLQRRSWHNYSKRLAQVAVKMSKWVDKLQAYTVQPTEGLVTNAQRALEVRTRGWQKQPAASLTPVCEQFLPAYRLCCLTHACL